MLLYWCLKLVNCCLVLVRWDLYFVICLFKKCFVVFVFFLLFFRVFLINRLSVFWIICCVVDGDLLEKEILKILFWLVEDSWIFLVKFVINVLNFVFVVVVILRLFLCVIFLILFLLSNVLVIIWIFWLGFVWIVSFCNNGCSIECVFINIWVFDE